MAGGLLGTVRGRVSLDVKQAVAAYATLRAENARLVYALRGTGDAFIASGKVMFATGAGMLYVFGKMVTAAGDFERKMDFFGAVTDTNAKKMRQLSKFTLQVAQDTIYSAGQIADGIVELGKAGVSAEQIMHGIGRAMANLGAAGDIPLEQSGQIITSTVAQFNLAAKDAVHVTDLLAGAANASIADIDDIGTSLKYVGGVADAAGLTLEDTTTAISLLAKAGIRGSTAGTSLRQMIVSFPGATGPATEALKKLGIITKDGTNLFYDQEGNLKSLSKVFQILQDHTDGLTNKQKLLYLRQIFNNRALSAAAILTRDGAKGFKQMYGEMSKVKAADVAHQRLNNLSGDLEILRGNIETLVIQQGGPFQKTARQWVKSLTRLVQAFGDLPPETQHAIIQTWALTGAALVAMGAFNILIGTLFKFTANMIKLAAGWKFLGNILKIVVTNLRWAVVLFGGELAAALGISAGVLAIIIVAVLAFAAAWYLAYKKIEPFRKAVNAWYGAIWKAIKAFASFLKLLATDPSAAWDKLKNGAKDALHWVEDSFHKIGPVIKSALSLAAAYIQAWVSTALHWLASLPGKGASIVSSFVSKIISLLTFKNLGMVLGTLVGVVVQIFVRMRQAAVVVITSMVTGVWKLFAMLAPKVGYALGFLLGLAVRIMWKLWSTMTSLAGKAVLGVIRFFAKLPGRILQFLNMMLGKAVSLLGQLATSLPHLAAEAAGGILNEMGRLPGQVAHIVSSVVGRAKAILGRLPGIALQLAMGFWHGLVNTIQDLPSVVSGIIGRVIEAFKSVIRSGYEAAKGFAEGLWNGFKDGLGINSPSFIEKHMFQMNKTVKDETRKLSRQTMSLQRLGKKMQDIKFSPSEGIPHPVRSAGIRKLASDQAANQKRARMLAAASGRRQDRLHSVHSKGPNGGRLVKGELDISPNGKAYIKGVAEDVYYDNDSFDISLGRM